MKTAFALLLLVCGFASQASAADSEMKRLTTFGESEKLACEAARTQIIGGQESNAKNFRFGSCTCAPDRAKGRTSGFECATYYIELWR
jgi:hypothetical protein